MELFTLGAGRGYTERDVREQARALTGFDNDWKHGVGDVNFRFDRERHDSGQQARSSARRGAFDWQDAVRALPPPPEAPVVLRRQALELLHPERRPSATQRRARARCTRERLRRSGPSSRRSSRHPGALRRPAHGEAAGRLHRGPAARARPRRSTRRVGVARSTGAASGCSRRRTSPAGTTTRWLDTAHVPRPLADRDATRVEPYALDRDKPTAQPIDRSRRRSSQARSTFWGNPRSTTATQRALLDVRARRARRRRHGTWKRSTLPRCCAQNALRQLIAVSPDMQTA